MTIRLTIKNEDTRKNAVVEVMTVDVNNDPLSGGTMIDLCGGDSTDVYVHSGQNVLITELRNGSDNDE